MSTRRSQAQAQQEKIESFRDAPCPVCGEPVGPAPTHCPTCDTPHHFDCWEFSGGCGVYACGVKVRRRREPTEKEPLPGKLGLPHKRTGAYAGYLWAPPGATAVLFLSEVVGISLLFHGLAEGWFYIGFMLLCFLWIGITSEHYYVDFEKRRISRAKALLGWDLWEWEEAPLEAFRSLALRDVPGSPRGPPPPREVVALRAREESALVLSPPLSPGSDELAAAEDLLRRVQASGAFPVQGSAPPSTPGLPGPSREQASGD